MIWEFALYSDEPIKIVETDERIDYDHTSFYGWARVMKPEDRLDLIPFLLVAPSERDMILDAFFSNVFYMQGSSSSVHRFLDHRLPRSSLLRISTLHLSHFTLRKNMLGNSDLNIRTLAAFIEWSMNVHFLVLDLILDGTDGRFGDELWFKLVAGTFFKRMIAGVDLRWGEHPICQEPEELMLQQYFEKFDVLDGGRMSIQAVMPWEIDKDVFNPPINQVKLSLFNEYWRLKPFTNTSGRLPKVTGVQDVPSADFALLFRQRDLKDCEKVVAQMEEQLDPSNYDEFEEKAAIYPTVVPPLKERVRRAQRLLKDMEAQTKWATQQKKKLCEGICSHVHRNVRIQSYHRGKDATGATRFVGVKNEQRRR